jgi:hypothetical protein
MSRIRILMFPAYFGLPSHFIPLVKLYQRLPPDEYEVAFFLPRLSPEEMAAQRMKGFNTNAQYYYSDDFISHFDIPLLGLKQRYGVMNELAAYTRFKPDLIIDDSSLTTTLARQFVRLPRLAIARSGVFGDPSTPPRYPHSLSASVSTLRVPPPLNFELPQSLDGYFEAEAHIVPATRALEPMPGLPDGGSRAFYSGPLMLDEREERLFYTSSLERFLEANQGGCIVYVTFGIDASRNPHSEVWNCMRDLLRRGFAIITNMRPVEQQAAASEWLPEERYFYSDALPLHCLCSRADLIVHICGSATYHYPILHGKPAITIGTQSRDREEVAQRLCARGYSLHLPAPAESDSFHELFADALNCYESARFPFDTGLAARLSALRSEIETTAASFDINAAIETALEAAPAPRSVV